MCPYFRTNTGVSIHPPPPLPPCPASAPHLHLPENDTVLPLSASCYLPMYLHQNCIATLLEFSSSGMPVSVLCRDHEYTATYTSIVNLQMRRLKQKGMLQKKKKANLKMGLQMCMTFKSSMKSHCFRPACDNFYMNAHGSRWGSAKS